MKKIYTLTMFLSFLAGISQEITTQDALRYAIDDITGTARFRGMSGAFGAVGGDLSSINANPAGSAIFNHNMFSVTASNLNTKNKSNYFNTNNKETYSTLDLNQLGAVFVFKDNNPENNWKKFAIALNYENTKNLDNNLSFSGNNTSNSIDQYFLRFANGIGNEGVFNINDANANFETLPFIDQQAWLGYNSYIVEHDATNNEYFTNVPDNTTYQQSRFNRSSGYNGKFSANFSTSFKDRLYLGMNLNLHFTDYTSVTQLKETNNGLYPDGASVSYIIFNNEQYTTGNGFSLNLGAIAKITDDFRLGLAYESPTWQNLTDQLYQNLYTERTEAPNNNTFLTKVTDPNITIEFAPYKIKTPAKWTLSGAYIINKTGLISADVSRKDYSNTQFKPVRDFSGINRTMSEDLTEAYEVRIGGEYKIKQISLRAGYRFEQSPYKADYAMGDLTGFSGGIGYNFGISRLDLAYSNSHRNYNQRFVSSGMNDTARIRTIQNNMTLTYSINF
ncbi:OmpP1/FadL family transporter [Flavobacterium sp.]|uniref:OmpP1/FadL family transporter n=1 Tax=Flavobacterium sp. TaxID=239 RepID=UPI0040475A4F